MSDYYYFGSEEEYQYALEHGFIGDALKSAGKFVRTTVNKVKLNYKRKKIEKTPATAENGVSSSEKSYRRSNTNGTGTGSMHNSGAAKSRREKSASRTVARNESLNKVAADARKREVWSKMAEDAKSASEKRAMLDSNKAVYNNAERNYQRRTQTNVTSWKHAGSDNAKSAVDKYRAQHPNSKLTDAQIMKNVMGISGSRSNL